MNIKYILLMTLLLSVSLSRLAAQNTNPENDLHLPKLPELNVEDIPLDSFPQLQKTNDRDAIFDNFSKVRFSGYIQGEYQYGQEYAILGVGTANEDYGNQSFSRIGIRRGRMKTAYEQHSLLAVFEIDVTEKGVLIRDAFLSVTDPFWKTRSFFQAGIFDRPFGYETQVSSSRLETPERSMVVETVFPGEKDLGGMIYLQAPDSSLLNPVIFQIGLFAGNGANQETDSKLDLIGRLGITKEVSTNVSVSGGISGYFGSVYQGTANVYKMDGKGFTSDTAQSNIGQYARRAYFGLDAQVTTSSSYGSTTLKGEYISGKQPGSEWSSRSPDSSTRPAYDTYIRNFRGWYITFVQDIGKYPVSAVIRYEVYDPNTKVKGNEVGQNGTSSTDIKTHRIGIGGIWKMSKALRLQAFYEFVNNEKTDHIEEYNSNLKDDIFTLRLQYKF